jgi:N-formylglutamate deformylase
MDKFHYIPGNVPVVVSIPHVGTHVPPAILERFTPAAKQLPDTDWHVDRLYAFAKEMGVHMVVATHSRYVVDLNRATDGQSLYPGKFTTGLCPATLFNGDPLYLEGKEPDKEEIDKRINDYWRPYHNQLNHLLRDLQQSSKRVVLFDAHSICSRVPTLFEGRLPDLNFGTADGASVDKKLSEALVESVQRSRYSVVLNGRFKGGYITRNYGAPDKGIHAVQLELAQVNYMNEEHPFAYDEAKAAQLQVVLKEALLLVVQWARG